MQIRSITKYDPQFRDKDGNYKNKEWISFYEVGSPIEGEVLTLDNYLKIENKYIDAAISFFEFHNCKEITIKNIEKYNFDGYFLEDMKELVTFFDAATEGIVVSIQGLRTYIILVLREIFWGQFFCIESEDVELKFGYDYYMYFKSNRNMDTLFEQIKKSGLFVW